MGRVLCTAMLVLCVFAFAVEAARHHENFAQGTYYDQNQKIDDQPEKVVTSDTAPVDDTQVKQTPIDSTDKPQPAPVDSTTTGVPDRYPTGYPGSEQYNTQFKAEDTDPEAKFSGYKTANVNYNTQVNTDSQDSTVVPDRYRYGYYGNAKPSDANPLFSAQSDPEAKFQQGKYVDFSAQTQVDDNSDPNAVIPNRYPEGYYGNAATEAATQGEADVYTSSKPGNHMKFGANVDNTADESQDIHERYPQGYYPGLNQDVQTNAQLSTSQQNEVSFQQYSNQQPRFGYEGIQGDFSTQLQGNEVPFELTGGACPTQYWITNPQKWPKFFNIKSKVTDAFGEKAAKVYGATTLLDALTDSRADPYSVLVNSGATAILNSYSRVQYKYKHPEVIESFNAALVSPDAAKKQAADFEEANVSVFSAGIGGSCT